MNKYWICDSCALKHNLKPFKSGYTLILGLCGWCESKKEQMLTPLIDLKSSKSIDDKGFKND